VVWPSQFELQPDPGKKRSLKSGLASPLVLDYENIPRARVEAHCQKEWVVRSLKVHESSPVKSLGGVPTEIVPYQS
jgi:hypothetical protein